MNQLKKVKIKITIEREGEEDNVIEMEYEDMVICQERGHVVVYGASTGGSGSIGPNGHGRVLIRAWRGCADYNAFVAREECSIALPTTVESDN